MFRPGTITTKLKGNILSKSFTRIDILSTCCINSGLRRKDLDRWLFWYTDAHNNILGPSTNEPPNDHDLYVLQHVLHDTFLG